MRYTIEKHGSDYALFLGQDRFHHGLNLCSLSDFDKDGAKTRKIIELALNAVNTKNLLYDTLPKYVSRGPNDVVLILKISDMKYHCIKEKWKVDFTWNDKGQLMVANLNPNEPNDGLLVARTENEWISENPGAFLIPEEFQ